MTTANPDHDNITAAHPPTADEFVHRSAAGDTYGDWGPPCFAAWTGPRKHWERHLASCAKCQRFVREREGRDQPRRGEQR